MVIFLHTAAAHAHFCTYTHPHTPSNTCTFLILHYSTHPHTQHHVHLLGPSTHPHPAAASHAPFSATPTCRKHASTNSFSSTESVGGRGGGVPQDAMWYMRALALSNFMPFQGGAPVAICSTVHPTDLIFTRGGGGRGAINPFERDLAMWILQSKLRCTQHTPISSYTGVCTHQISLFSEYPICWMTSGAMK
jgi:hypothetical protein